MLGKKLYHAILIQLLSEKNNFLQEQGIMKENGFSYYTEECVLDIIASIDNVDMVEMWISEDKLNRSETKWINCILKLVK